MLKIAFIHTLKHMVFCTSNLDIKIFAPIHGSVMLKGKRVKNIVISGFRHDQLHQNQPIPEGRYKGKRLSDIIKENI